MTEAMTGGKWRRWLARQEKAHGTPIFDDATSLTRLREGFDKVRRNKGAPGGDGMTIGLFSFGLEQRLRWLRERLRDGSYEPGPLAHVRIAKKSGRGERVLSIPCVVDRVAQSAALLAVQPRAEAEFEDVSRAYRPGRGVKQALARLRHLHRQGYDWVVDADIRAYFDNVPHLQVLAALGSLVPERPFLDLAAKWLEGSRFAGRGLPQGAPISPLLANLYLDRVDEALMEAGFRLVRYADDFVILCRLRERAEKALRLAASLLAEMGLELNPEKTAIRRLDEGYHFLGADIRRTTLAEQMERLRGDAEAPPQEDGDGGAEGVLEGKLGVPGSRRMLGKDYETPEGAPRADDVARLDSPWAEAETAAEDDGPAALEPAADAALAAASRYAPFIRPLYVTGARQRLDVWQTSGLAVFEDGALLGAIHPGAIDRIDLFPGAEASAEALRRAAAQRIPVFFVNRAGRVQGALTPAQTMRAGLHLAQARHALDEGLALALARRFAGGRIYNARRLLQRLRNRLSRSGHEEAREKLAGVIRRMDHYRRKAELDPDISSLNALRGVEASAAKLYWPALAALLRRGMAEKAFRRTRMPAGSPFNTLLNWTASLLRRDIETLMVKRDLHPGFGVLHAVNDTRQGLVFDLMEEFRAPLAEGLAASLLSRGILGPGHFDTFRMDGRKAVWLVNGGAGKTARAWEKMMDAKVRNPATGAWTTWRGMMNYQISAYVNHVLGEAAYEPYRMDM